MAMMFLLQTQYQQLSIEKHLKKGDNAVVILTLENGGALHISKPVTFDGMIMSGVDADGDAFTIFSPAIVSMSFTFSDPEDDDTERQMHEWQELLAALRVACGESEDPAVKAALAKLEEYEGGNGAN